MNIVILRSLSPRRRVGVFAFVLGIAGCELDFGGPDSAVGEDAALEDAEAARGTLALQISGTDDVAGRNDDFVVLSAPGSASRPSAALTISLLAAPGRREQISLSAAGGGAISFDRNVLEVTSGTSSVVRVFGERVSGAVDDVSIRVRIDGSGHEATEDLSVIDGVSLVFTGNFQDRLATDPDPRTEPRGVFGSTRALEGEVDLDNVIRFSEPVDLRLFCAFDPVRVIGVRAQRPVGAQFVDGDSLIGAQVDLGPSSQFIDEEGDLNPEQIDGFALNIGTIHATGEFPWGGPAVYLSGPALDGILADYSDRESLLRAARMIRPDDDIEARRIDARLQLRADFQYDQWQLLFGRSFCGTAQDGRAAADGYSQLLALLHNAPSLDYRIDFFGFDADCLRGVVTGTLRPSTAGAPELCPDE